MIAELIDTAHTSTVARSGSAARRRATTRASPGFLVEAGIDSISVDPRQLHPVKHEVAAAEAEAPAGGG